MVNYKDLTDSVRCKVKTPPHGGRGEQSKGATMKTSTMFAGIPFAGLAAISIGKRAPLLNYQRFSKDNLSAGI
jgi:hypothetical protein